MANGSRSITLGLWVFVSDIRAVTAELLQTLVTLLGLESPSQETSPVPAVETLQHQASLTRETQRRLNYIDQRIADAEKRAEQSRRKKAASATNMPLAGKPLFQLSSLRHKPHSLGSLHLTYTGEHFATLCTLPPFLLPIHTLTPVLYTSTAV